MIILVYMFIRVHFIFRNSPMGKFDQSCARLLCIWGLFSRLLPFLYYSRRKIEALFVSNKKNEKMVPFEMYSIFFTFHVNRKCAP